MTLKSKDETLLSQFPEGYRHLAYLQTQIGFTVKRDMPTLKGPAVERLYAAGAAWLKQVGSETTFMNEDRNGDA